MKSIILKILAPIILFSLTSHARDEGVLVAKNEEKNLFLFPTESAPHKVKSSAKDTDTGIIMAEVRFISGDKVEESSIFARHPSERTKFQLALADSPSLMIRNYRYSIGFVRYQELINNKWSKAKSQTAGRLSTIIKLNPNVQKVKLTEIQFK